jgi:hypothetical protein
VRFGGHPEHHGDLGGLRPSGGCPGTYQRLSEPNAELHVTGWRLWWHLVITLDPLGPQHGEAARSRALRKLLGEVYKGLGVRKGIQFCKVTGTSSPVRPINHVPILLFSPF